MAVVELGHSSSWAAKEVHMQGPRRTWGQGFEGSSCAEAADVC